VCVHTWDAVQLLLWVCSVWLIQTVQNCLKWLRFDTVTIIETKFCPFFAPYSGCDVNTVINIITVWCGHISLVTDVRGNMKFEVDFPSGGIWWLKKGEVPGLVTLWGQVDNCHWLKLMPFPSVLWCCHMGERNVVVVVKCIYKPYVSSHLVATSSAECNGCRLPSSLDYGHRFTICDIVSHLPQGNTSVAARPHFFRQDLQWLWLVQKWFRSAD